MVRRRAVLAGVVGLGTAGCLSSSDESASVPEPEVQSDGIHRQGEWLDLEQAAVEQSIHDRVNAERETDLEYSDRLGRIARFHSWQMATEGFYDHEGPDGGRHPDRYERFGYSCGASAENILKTWALTEIDGPEGETVTYSDGAELAAGAVAEWLHSEGHRENLLDPRWTAEGIGAWWVADDEYGGVRVYLTQNFC